MITYIDLFAGIGGFRLGLDPRKFKCLFSSDINEAARKVYENNYNEIPLGDICEISSEVLSNYPTVDLITGGFPCQPFSISGLKKGFEDENRGNMFFEIIRLTRLLQPKALFLENVANIVNHDKGNTLKTILSTIKEEGYTVHWAVLDSGRYSLPQHRKRTFILAFKDDKPFDFPIPHDRFVPMRDFLDSESTMPYLDPKEYTLLTEEQRNVSPNNMLFVGYLNKKRRTNGVREEAVHLSRNHRQINRIYSIDYIHPTLTSSEKSGRFYILDDIGVRKVSINELYRFQGFPEDFIKHPVLSEQYQQIGNSVSVNLIKEISELIHSKLSHNL